MFKKIMASLAVIGGLMLMAQAPVKPVDGLGNEQMLGPGGRRVITTMQVLTTSPVAAYSSTIKVVTLFCANNTGSAATVTITDGGSRPFFTAVSMAANSSMQLVAGSGLTFTSGLTWQAGTSSAIYCQIEGVQ